VQHKIVGHRVDFALTPLDRDTPVLAIELDGHEFHERTKKQARADKARDRSILATGCPVVRFTGSEVWRDPAGCWRESLSLLGGTKAA
jgi:very-short-patch-repair endonuclease